MIGAFFFFTFMYLPQTFTNFVPILEFEKKRKKIYD